MNEPIRLSEYNALIREVLESNGEFRLYPRGISMLPLLRQGRDSVALRRVDSVPEEGVSPDWVIGRVTRIFRDDKEVSCDGMGYRLYLLLWQFTITRGFLLKLCHLSERRNAL